MRFLSLFLVFSSVISSAWGYGGCFGRCPTLGGPCCRPELEPQVEECRDPDAPVVCYEPYVRYEKKMVCEPKCDFECRPQRVKRVRYIAKPTKVKCIRYVPQVIEKECMKYEPEYYYEECCNYVPHMRVEKKEETVAKKFYKRVECKK